MGKALTPPQGISMTGCLSGGPLYSCRHHRRHRGRPTSRHEATGLGFHWDHWNMVGNTMISETPEDWIKEVSLLASRWARRQPPEVPSNLSQSLKDYPGKHRLLSLTAARCSLAAGWAAVLERLGPTAPRPSGGQLQVAAWGWMPARGCEVPVVVTRQWGRACPQQVCGQCRTRRWARGLRCRSVEVEPQWPGDGFWSTGISPSPTKPPKASKILTPDLLHYNPLWLRKEKFLYIQRPNSTGMFRFPWATQM